MTAKTCTRPTCQQDNPQPLDNFARAASSKDDRRGVCKSCRNAEYNAAREGQKDAKNAERRARYAADPSGQQRASRAWYAANSDRKSETQRAWRQANKDRTRAHEAARRAREVGAQTGPVDYAAARASRPDCYLCGEALSGIIHVEHVIPLARGGAHCQANLLPAHKACNLRKHDLLLSELDWYSGPTDLGTRLA